jgi:hypothetical protein
MMDHNVAVSLGCAPIIAHPAALCQASICGWRERNNCRLLANHVMLPQAQLPVQSANSLTENTPNATITGAGD